MPTLTTANDDDESFREFKREREQREFRGSRWGGVVVAGWGNVVDVEHVVLVSAATMLNDLQGAELHGRLERALRKHTMANLLVIEDFAVLAMDPAHAKLAFQVISERYDHRRSTAVTTNRPFQVWPKVFPDALNAQVIAERVTERSEVFVLDGRSYPVSKT